MKKLSLTLIMLASMLVVACGNNDAETMTKEEPASSNDNLPGSIVSFGTYQQNSSQKDAINWIVLKFDDNKALLLSKDLLSARPWDETGNNLTWDNSSIREWLNNEFLNNAFSKEEINSIVSTELDNSDQQGYGTPSGKNTTDKVFLLSVDEFNNLVKNTTFATASPTKLAVEEGAYSNDQGNAAWWLRSPGMTNESPAYLSSAGELGTRAHKATEKEIGIRPAVWIELK